MGLLLRSTLWMFLLLSLAPLSFYLCFWCWLIFKLRPKFNTRSRSIPKPVVVILGGRRPQTLHMCRLFSAAGFQVVVCDTYRIFFSCSACSVHCDKYYQLPHPKSQPESYNNKVCSVVVNHKASLFIPMEQEHSTLDAQIINQLGDSVISMAFDAVSFQELDDKIAFFEGLRKRGVPASEHHVITQPSQVRAKLTSGTASLYVLKPAYKTPQMNLPTEITVPTGEQELSNFLEARPIGLSFPFLLQPVMNAPVFSTCTLVVNGNVVAQTFMVRQPGSPAINHQDNGDIERWIQNFVKCYPRSLTGWMSLDFMRSTHDNQWYPINCQPRLSFQFLLFLEADMVIKEFLQHLHPQNHHRAGEQVIMVSQKLRRKLPIKPKCKELFWIFSELHSGLTCRKPPWTLCKKVVHLINGNEAIFRFGDPLPFFIYNCLYLPLLILRNFFGERRNWTGIDFCLGILK